jgi:hypothetical protein
VVVTGCAVSGADPLVVLFTQLSAVAAIGVMTLMVAVSVAALRFYHRGGGTNEGPWTRVGAPLAGAVSVGAILVTTVANLDSVLGTRPGAPAALVLPSVVVLTGAAGLLWGLRMRRRPDVYRAIGLGEPEPLAELEQHLAHVDV